MQENEFVQSIKRSHFYLMVHMIIVLVPWLCHSAMDTVSEISMALPDCPYSAAGTTQMHSMQETTKGEALYDNDIQCTSVIANVCTENGMFMGIKS